MTAGFEIQQVAYRSMWGLSVEVDLAYWHEIDAGFAGRQPIVTF